jgi:hypothetical protein
MRRFLVLALLPLFMLLTGGKALEAAHFTNGQKVSVEGRVRLVGSEPFTRFVITTTNGIDFYLPGTMKRGYSLYRIYQGLEVKTPGNVYIRKRVTADFKHTNYEALLSNVNIQALNSNSQKILDRRRQNR